nr:MAG TPA: hypothetical protein [Caudoviricetes sp.]
MRFRKGNESDVRLFQKETKTTTKDRTETKD